MPGPQAGTAVEPRLAATVLLVRDDPFEVLLVKRSAVGSFPSRQVFPGGVVEQQDMHDKWRALCCGTDGLDATDLAYRMAGLRECWEEAGLLCLASKPPLQLPPAGSDGGFHSWAEQHGACIDFSGMADFAHWITPPSAPKRWDTRFLLARAPERGDLQCDGIETVHAEWVEPARALERDARYGSGLLFSTKANLQLLARAASVDEALEAARSRVMVPITPLAERANGRVRISIPEDAGYPVSEAWMDDVPMMSQPGR